MMRTLIIDDEKNAREVLRMQLSQYCPEVEIIGLATGGQEGIDQIRAFSPDLVFLDIEMPRVNGFDVLQATSPHRFQIIFTTAYDQFAIRAFKYSALDYLLKPIDIEELKSAVQRARANPATDLEVRLEKLYDALHHPPRVKDRISVPSGDGYEVIRFADIVRCESDSNYTDVILVGGRRIKLTRTLKDVEEGLPARLFFRIHHSHLINLDHIARFYKTDGGYVVMSDGQQINISRQRKDDFFEFMK